MQLAMNLVQITFMSVLVKRNSTFFAFSLIIEGTTEKVLQLIMPPLQSICHQNLGFVEQKITFLILQRGSSNKNPQIDITFVLKIFFCSSLQSCPLKACVSITQRCALPLEVHRMTNCMLRKVSFL
jgi:hypothetical protein